MRSSLSNNLTLQIIRMTNDNHPTRRSNFAPLQAQHSHLQLVILDHNYNEQDEIKLLKENVRTHRDKFVAEMDKDDKESKYQ